MVGHHKLVHDLGEGLRRARGYSLPREHARMQAIGRQGSLPAKTLIISYKTAWPDQRVTLVPQSLSF